jgi:hypothetical protein
MPVCMLAYMRTGQGARLPRVSMPPDLHATGRKETGGPEGLSALKQRLVQGVLAVLFGIPICMMLKRCRRVTPVLMDEANAEDSKLASAGDCLVCCKV